ncbi:MAG: hypothetical protein GF311_25285 [Candidatus Lokiarchaeota archaeon]|nr:hypothetical protein [Candidatus Lokiarchaeota archaeon]
MRSRERVRAAIHFNEPDIVPVWNGWFFDDVFVLAPMPSKSWQPGHCEEEKGLFPHAGDDKIIKMGLWKWKEPDWVKKDPNLRNKGWLNVKREEISEWGVYWNRRGDNSSMGHIGRPSLLNWDNLDKYLEKYTPDTDDSSKYSYFRRISHLLGRRKYRLCMLGRGGGPFMGSAAIRGFSNFLIDHKKNTKKLIQLIDHYTEWLISSMDGWIKYGGKPDGFLINEDLGEQNGPFVSPKTFKEIYAPFYKKLFKAAHDRGCEIHQHCCGKVDPLLPLLIDWGLDAIEFDSPRMSGYKDLKPFRGKIMFWGCVDIQTIYTKGTPKECEREVWHMMKNLGTPRGGYGAYFYSQSDQIQVPRENIKAFKNGLKKYGVYSKIPDKWWQYP